MSDNVVQISFTFLIETTQIKKLDKKLLVEKSQIF